MKSFIWGVLTVFILGVIGFYTFKATTSFINKSMPTPSATPSISPSIIPSATPKPSILPEPYMGPTTKGGLPIEQKVKTGTVKGLTTSKSTTSDSHFKLTLLKTSVCPISYTTQVENMNGPLTLHYELIKDTSFGITVWHKDGNELLGNTTYSGNSGFIKTISGVDYMKVRVESKSCASNNDNWLTLTAER